MKCIYMQIDFRARCINLQVEGQRGIAAVWPINVDKLYQFSGLLSRCLCGLRLQTWGGGPADRLENGGHAASDYQCHHQQNKDQNNQIMVRLFRFH